jgi:hypothetical protein
MDTCSVAPETGRVNVERIEQWERLAYRILEGCAALRRLRAGFVGAPALGVARDRLLRSVREGEDRRGVGDSSGKSLDKGVESQAAGRAGGCRVRPRRSGGGLSDGR